MKKILLLSLLIATLLYSCGNESSSPTEALTENVNDEISDTDTKDENDNSDVKDDETEDEETKDEDYSDVKDDDNNNDTDEEENKDDSTDVDEEEENSDKDTTDVVDTTLVEEDTTIVEDTIPTPDNGIELPMSFTKRVLFEKVSGTWCGYCPRAVQVLREIEESIGEDNVVSVSYQYGDEMESEDGMDVVAALGGVSGYPVIAINRKGNVTMFESTSYAQRKAETDIEDIAECGVMIDATADSIIVYAGFLNDISGDIRVTVAILESGLIYDQSSYLNTTTGSDYYGLGSTLKDFEFNHVFRKMLSSEVLGEEVTADKDAITRLAFEGDFSGFDKSNCSIVAIIADADNGVLNTINCDVGEKTTW